MITVMTRIVEVAAVIEEEEEVVVVAAEAEEEEEVTLKTALSFKLFLDIDSSRTHSISK